ncbi:glycosyltransferase family 2 protein [Candidatus Woesearchaeota archaeon]|nr:glycosyltransferase family 2 protein [Candidatus Woesearchaeota archaeon]
MNPKFSLIIPCYNEEEGIPPLAAKIAPVLTELGQKFALELIFVDDGSKDKTFELLNHYFGSRPDTKIICHEKNKNLGAAMRTGFAAATGDFVATMDSDCTYDPQGLVEMMKLIDDCTSIVTASPYHPRGGVENVPGYRLFLSKGITLLYRLVTGIKIHTFTALFRVYTKDVVKSVQFHSPDFLATAEVLVNAHAAGHTIREYPAVLHVREYGVSKIRLLRVMRSHARYLLLITPRSVARRLHLLRKK